VVVKSLFTKHFKLYGIPQKPKEIPPKALIFEIRRPKWWDLLSFGKFWLEQTLNVWLSCSQFYFVLEFGTNLP